MENYEIEKEERFAPEKDYVEELLLLIRSTKNAEELAEKIGDYHDNDIAGAFEMLEKEERIALYKALGAERFSEIFAYVEDPEEYLDDVKPEVIAEILENMDSDDALDILDEVDDETEEKIVSLMDEESSRDIQLLRSYEDDEIGSKMTTNFISMPKDLTIKQAMKSLVSQAGENDNISTIYTFDENGAFFGAVDLKDLIVARENAVFDDLISTSYPFVGDHEKIPDCLERIREYTEDSFPVLNEEGKILGIITAQDITEVVGEELGEDYAKLAGLTAEEDLEEGIFTSIKKRIPWLVVLLFLGIGVSSVVGIFEAVVAQIALIVCFQSLVLDMAGNVGTQSLAVTIRVLMDEGVEEKDRWKLVWKELRVGFINGLILGSVSFLLIGLYINLLKGYPVGQAFAISGCVGVALLVAMVISSLVGTTVPMLFHKIGVDPAVASGPLITTVNDLVAVVCYYGLAWILLINVMKIV